MSLIPTSGPLSTPLETSRKAPLLVGTAFGIAAWWLASLVSLLSTSCAQEVRFAEEHAAGALNSANDGLGLGGDTVTSGGAANEVTGGPASGGSGSSSGTIE